MLRKLSFLSSLLIVIISGCSKKSVVKPTPPGAVNPQISLVIDNYPVFVNSTWKNVAGGTVKIEFDKLDKLDSVVSRTTDTANYSNFPEYKKTVSAGRYGIQVTSKDQLPLADTFIRFNARTKTDITETTKSVALTAGFTDGLITLGETFVQDNTVPVFKADADSKEYKMSRYNGFYYIYVKGGQKGVVTFRSNSTYQTITKAVDVKALNHYNMEVVTANGSLQVVFTKFTYNPVVVRPVVQRFVLIKAGNECYIRTNFSSTKSLVQKVILAQSFDSGTFDFGKTFLINKNAGNSVGEYEAGNMVVNQTDDTSPINTNGQGNFTEGHGLLCPVVTTYHNKTQADLLSQWTDGVHTFYLVKIISANKLLFYCKPFAGTRDSHTTGELQGPVLKHVSGGVNTSDINAGNFLAVKQFPVVSNIVNKIYADGAEITANGLYNVKEVKFLCEYDAIDPNTLVLTNPFSFNNGKPFMHLSASYVYQPNGACIPHINIKFTNPKYINYYSGLQAGKLPLTTGYPRLFGYLPKVKAVNGIDYKNIVETTVTPPSINFDPSTISDPELPPDRYIQLMANKDGVKQLGFAMGFNTAFGVAQNSMRKNLGVFWQLAGTGKSYPRVIFAYPAADQSIDLVGYRIWFDARAIGNATALYSYREAGADYVYIDYHKNVDNETLLVDPSLTNGKIEVVESIGAITLHTHDVVPETGLVISVSGGYGMLLLKVTR